MSQSTSSNGLTAEEQAVLNGGGNGASPTLKPRPQSANLDKRQQEARQNTMQNASDVAQRAAQTRNSVLKKLDEMQERRDGAISDDAQRLAHLLSPVSYVDDLVSAAGALLKKESAALNFFDQNDPFKPSNWSLPEPKRVQLLPSDRD